MRISKEERKMKKNTIAITIFLIIIFIVALIGFLTMLEMNKKISEDCSKINNSGIIKYLDADINCSILNNITRVGR